MGLINAEARKELQAKKAELNALIKNSLATYRGKSNIGVAYASVKSKLGGEPLSTGNDKLLAFKFNYKGVSSYVVYDIEHGTIRLDKKCSFMTGGYHIVGYGW